MKAKMDSEDGKRVYARRLGIVEPVFANICVQKRMNRFTLRTKRKVDVQWGLFALVHNIGKIHTFGALLQAHRPIQPRSEGEIGRMIINHPCAPSEKLVFSTVS